MVEEEDSSRTLLKIEGLSKLFYGLAALDDVSLQVERGELVGLIGPNGSGKTTLFNCVTGFLPCTKGRVIFRGEDITGWKPNQIARKGIIRTFQELRVFRRMSVLDNMVLGVQEHQDHGVLRSVIGTGSIQAHETEARQKATQLLEFAGMVSLKDELAGNLSYGQQKILSFLGALMPEPGIVLLDEPTAAVNPTLVEAIKDYIKLLNERGRTFVVIEHNMKVIMDICSRVIVLDHGRKIAEGSAEQIQNDPRVVEAYFGV